MTSQLILDRSDAAVNDLVKDWEDGKTYQVMLTVTQSKSSPNMTTFHVDKVTDHSSEMGDMEGAEEGGGEEEMGGEMGGRGVGMGGMKKGGTPKRPAVEVNY